MRPQVDYIQSVYHLVISLFGRVELSSNSLTLLLRYSSYKVHLPKVYKIVNFYSRMVVNISYECHQTDRVFS